MSQSMDDMSQNKIVTNRFGTQMNDIAPFSDIPSRTNGTCDKSSANLLNVTSNVCPNH